MFNRTETLEKNFQLASIYTQKVASDYFPEVHALVKKDVGGEAFFQIGTWIPPRSFELGKFSKKVSLELPSSVFAQKVEALFMEVTTGEIVNGD